MDFLTSKGIYFSASFELMTLQVEFLQAKTLVAGMDVLLRSEHVFLRHLANLQCGAASRPDWQMWVRNIYTLPIANVLETTQVDNAEFEAISDYEHVCRCAQQGCPHGEAACTYRAAVHRAMAARWSLARAAEVAALQILLTKVRT